MTPVDVVRQARALLAEPEAWMQGGVGLRFGDGPEPVAMCAVQAVWTAADNDRELGWAAVDALEATVHRSSVAAWNDDPERTHAEVLAALDATIARLESE